MNKCIHFVAPFFLIGCGLRNVDKPAPSSYELWKKDGMSIVEVQIDMLECGYPNPMGYFESTFEDGGVNAFAMAGRCLKRIGYRYVGNSGVSCDSSHFASLPACQNDKPIWEPDYHRRLNSPFCKESPKAYACQPPGSPIPTDAELEMLARQRRIESSRSPDPGTPERKLTEQIQKQNNRGMDQLQRFTK